MKLWRQSDQFQCSTGQNDVKPTGDAGNDNSLMMRAQRLYQEIMESVEAQTYGDEEEDEDEENPFEEEEAEKDQGENPREKRKREESKSKNCRNKKRANIANQLTDVTNMFRENQFSQMMMMMRQQQQMMMQLFSRISIPPASPPSYSPYMPDYNMTPFIPSPANMRVPMTPTSGILPENLFPPIVQTSDEWAENTNTDKE